MPDGERRHRGGAERTLPAVISSFATALRSEHRQLPRVGSFVVTDEIGVTVFACEFEISIVKREPSVDHLRDGTRQSPRINVRGVCSPRWPA
jgi:hypothetical protein